MLCVVYVNETMGSRPSKTGLRIISNNREFWYWGVQLDPDLLVTISSLYPEWFRVSAYLEREHRPLLSDRMYSLYPEWFRVSALYLLPAAHLKVRTRAAYRSPYHHSIQSGSG